MLLTISAFDLGRLKWAEPYTIFRQVIVVCQYVTFKISVFRQKLLKVKLSV